MRMRLTIGSPNKVFRRCFISLAACEVEMAEVVRWWRWSTSNEDDGFSTRQRVPNVNACALEPTLLVNVTTMSSSGLSPHSLTRYATLHVRTRVLPVYATTTTWRSVSGQGNGLRASIAPPDPGPARI